jgi:hypothetical protein
MFLGEYCQDGLREDSLTRIELKQSILEVNSICNFPVFVRVHVLAFDAAQALE